MFEWSATKINIANYCRRRYFLRYVLKYPELNLSCYKRGKLIHKLIEHFWENLGEKDEIKIDKKGRITSRKKYSNEEQFLYYAQRQWTYNVMQDEKANREIVWAFPNQFWQIKNDYLPKVCIPLFSYLVEEGPPLFSELEFDFSLFGRKFVGFIDEIRLRGKDVVIRDYKTERPWIGPMKISRNPQLTLYCVGLSALCFSDNELAKKVRLEDEARMFMGNPKFISERIKPEFFMIDTLAKDSQKVKTMPQLIYSTTRKDEDFFTLLEFIEDIEKLEREFLGMETKKIPPVEGGIKCDECDMSRACVSVEEKEINERIMERNQVKERKDSLNQLYFDFVAPYYRKQTKFKIKQKRFQWKK